MAATQIFESIREFIKNSIGSISSGWLLFGGPLDVVLMLVDVAVASAVIYFLLKLMNDSRAWQLLKGLVLILLLSLVSSLLGLSAINFVLSKSISALAIGFVVIFQPEFRRALETVGRSSLRFVDVISSDGAHGPGGVDAAIEAIVKACERMASTRTGALVILERKTKLGELIQENAVIVDAALTSTALEQIFYKGSPLHDGAVLIRGGRIYAARCHVPLSDTYHMRRDFGLRHRAAVGASEIGDAVAVVVSEERGRISLTVGGRLYPLENGDSLRVLLHDILFEEEGNGQKRGLRMLFHNAKQPAERGAADGPQAPDVKKSRPPRRRGVILQLVSVLLAFVLWGYVQVMTNPIKEVNLSGVNVQIAGVDKLDEAGLDYSLGIENMTDLRFQVRQKYEDRITRENVAAKIDFSALDFADIKEEIAGGSSHIRLYLPINVSVSGLGEAAYRVTVRYPSEIIVILSRASQP